MSPVPPIEAVAFDLDGLMFNTEDLYDLVLEALLAQRGHAFSLELKLRMMGLPGLQAIDVMREEKDLSESPQQLLDEVYRRMLELLPQRLATLPGLESLLDLLEQLEIPRSIATSSTPAFARACLDQSGLGDHFRFVLTTEDVERGKPYPDIYLESARRHAVAAERMLVLEDSLTGSRAAVAAGTWTVAVPGRHSRDVPFDHVNLVVDSLESSRLRSLLESNPAG